MKKRTPHPQGSAIFLFVSMVIWTIYKELINADFSISYASVRLIKETAGALTSLSGTRGQAGNQG